mgnify:CR=1 FL=1
MHSGHDARTQAVIDREGDEAAPVATHPRVGDQYQGKAIRPAGKRHRHARRKRGIGCSLGVKKNQASKLRFYSAGKCRRSCRAACYLHCRLVRASVALAAVRAADSLYLLATCASTTQASLVRLICASDIASL